MQTTTLLSVMGDFTLPEIMVRVSRCSKKAHQAITPLLERKMQDAGELYNLMYRLFYDIRDLPSEEDAEYYRGLLDSYFTNNNATTTTIHTIDATNEMVRTALRHNVKSHDFDQRMTLIIGPITPAMDTSDGRRRLLQSIEYWRERTAEVRMYHNPENKLDVMDYSVRSDFAIRDNQITSMHA